MFLVIASLSQKEVAKGEYFKQSFHLSFPCHINGILSKLTELHSTNISDRFPWHSDEDWTWNGISEI
jgi:hypothetical protein